MNDNFIKCIFAEATHWIPTKTDNLINFYTGVTIGKAYKFIQDTYDDETVIIDDEGVYSMIYMCHDGICVKEKENNNVK